MLLFINCLSKGFLSKRMKTMQKLVCGFILFFLFFPVRPPVVGGSDGNKRKNFIALGACVILGMDSPACRWLLVLCWRNGHALYLRHPSECQGMPAWSTVPSGRSIHVLIILPFPFLKGFKHLPTA